MSEHTAENDARCGDSGGPPGIDPCIRDKGHAGRHGYAGVFWLGESGRRYGFLSNDGYPEEGPNPLIKPEPSAKGCDCTELCEMGPTCPGGMLAGLPGSGCTRVIPPGETTSERGADA